MDKKVAFLVDGGYFIRRVDFFNRKFFKDSKLTPHHIVSLMQHIVMRHQGDLKRDELYRIYFYDAPPFEGQLREPVPRPDKPGLRSRNFKTDERTVRQHEFHKQLGKTRKVALRMGELASTKRWLLSDYAQKDLLNGNKQVADLQPEDFYLDLQQKGVDTRLGIDITTLSLNKLVDTIVLIASDADFIPAAKLARTHGVDVMLDPLFGNVAQGLERHIDGKRSYDLVSKMSQLLGIDPYPIPDWWKKE